jgi:hypothetical protein
LAWVPDDRTKPSAAIGMTSGPGDVPVDGVPDTGAARPRRRWLRWLGFLFLLGLIVTVLLSFHQPPMRLMPVPLAFEKSGARLFAANANLAADNRIELFYASNRLAVGPRNDRIHAIAPGRDLLLGVTSIRIGDEGTGWDRVLEWSMGVDGGKRPQLILQRMVELATLGGDEPLPGPGPVRDPALRAWLGLVDDALARSADPDIIIYVHGANSTVERAAGQAAQLRHFTGQNSVVLLFAWPTAENFLVYPRDIVKAFGAAPQLARLVGLLAAHTRARRIDVLSYSAGGTVASDGLALLGAEAASRGYDPRLGEVHHAAPDADFRGFVGDLRDYAGTADRVTVSLNMQDSALRLSEVINRASRAGRPDLRELSPGDLRFLRQANRELGLEIVEVRGEDIPGMSRRSHGFWYMDPWVASDVLLKLMFSAQAPERGLVRTAGPEELEIWRFPADYDARLPGVIAGVSAGGGADQTISGGADRPARGGADRPARGGADQTISGGADQAISGGADQTSAGSGRGEGSAAPARP